MSSRICHLPVSGKDSLPALNSSFLPFFDIVCRPLPVITWVPDVFVSPYLAASRARMSTPREDISMKTLLCLFFTAGLAVSTVEAQNNFSYEGLFLTDDQVQLFDFTLASGSTVTMESWEYGGGTNAHNQVIPAGGFDSYFTWYGSDGSQIGTDDDCNGGPGHPHNGACLDAYAQVFLPAGSYVLALTESGNFPNGSLSDGFTEEGQGNFTANGNCPAFCDTFGNTDNGNWAVDILNVTSATQAGATPEPSTWVLSIGGIALLLVAWRRRANQAA
jgi:hypothetical protein